jgi:hypothetical protein
MAHRKLVAQVESRSKQLLVVKPPKQDARPPRRRCPPPPTSARSRLILELGLDVVAGLEPRRADFLPAPVKPASMRPGAAVPQHSGKPLSHEYWDDRKSPERNKIDGT